MIKEWKIQVIHDDTDEVVKTLEYSSQSLRSKGFSGLLRNMNLRDYTAHFIDPPTKRTED
jgi:hypothetical protein